MFIWTWPGGARGWRGAWWGSRGGLKMGSNKGKMESNTPCWLGSLCPSEVARIRNKRLRSVYLSADSKQCSVLYREVYFILYFTQFHPSQSFWGPKLAGWLPWHRSSGHKLFFAAPCFEQKAWEEQADVCEGCLLILPAFHVPLPLPAAWSMETNICLPNGFSGIFCCSL